MNLRDIIYKIVEIEWPMFQAVNGDIQVGCQEDHRGFCATRSAQYGAWSWEAAESWLSDLCVAANEGRNLVRERYIHMMASTDPEGYKAFRRELRPVSPEKEHLVREISTLMLEDTEKLRRLYPRVALGGRPLHTSEEQNGWASVETYLVGELLTYSEATLRVLLDYAHDLQASGQSLARRTLENTVATMGYSSLEEAERRLDKK